MKKLSVYLAGVLTLLVFALSVNAQEYDYISNERKTPYWRDVNVVKAHKEYPRTQFMTFENENDALS